MLYRPSNGTEGDAFISVYCEKCIYFKKNIGCPILFASMLFDKKDENYPQYWVIGKDGPECTMFCKEVQ